MKSNYVNAISVKTIFRNVFFVSFFTVLTVMGVNAQKVADTLNTGTASVTYLGSSNEQMSFALKYENETGEKYVITILDSEGITLFDGSFSEKKFNKTFKVPSEIGNLTFIISNYKNRAEKKFAVTTERRLVEEVYVTKSK
jgi:hypothetical protein